MGTENHNIRHQADQETTSPTKTEINLAKAAVVIIWLSAAFALWYDHVIIWGGH